METSHAGQPGSALDEATVRECPSCRQTGPKEGQATDKFKVWQKCATLQQGMCVWV